MLTPDPQQPYTNSHFLTHSPQNIGIIGAGASGLISAKVLRNAGFTVEVLEGKADLGGVWLDNYEGAGLQSRFTHYNMPDHEFPADTPMLPKQHLVYRYLSEYAAIHQLRSVIRFSTTVKSIEQADSGQWTVHTAGSESLRYDLLLICTGAYHAPYLPDIPGLSEFSGTVLHSSECKGPVVDSAFAGKRVVVIGGQKSAFDILKLASDLHASSVTGVMREVHWSVPLGLKICGIRIGYFLYTRAAELLLPNIEGNPLLEWLKKPFIWLYWKLLEFAMGRDLPPALKPTTSLISDRLAQIMSRDESFTARVRSHNATIIHGLPARITTDGVIVQNTLVPADTIVLATGFSRNFLGVQTEEDGLWAYRNVIIPGKRALAVIGISQPLYAILHTNMQAAWLAAVLKGRVHLPSFAAMQQSINTKRAVVRKQLSTAKRSYIWCGGNLTDVLLQDMGHSTRLGKSFRDYWFSLPNPRDYLHVLNSVSLEV